MAEPWFVEAFRTAYLDVYPHRDLESARAEARYLVARGVRGRALDLCCGNGRHVQALRELGVEAFGIDLSRDLLDRARDVRQALACGDARAIPVAGARMDAVVSLFSSFGYFGEAGDQAVVAEIGRVLRPGGRFVLDLMNPERIRATLVPASTASRGGVEIEERRSLAEGGRRVRKEIRLKGRDGAVRSWLEDVRLYDASELEPWFRGAGLAFESVHGDFDGSELGRASPRQILVGSKR